MSKTMEEVTSQLNEKMPREIIRDRSVRGMTLSYVEGWAVIDRLNQVFGQGNWSYSVPNLTKSFEGKITKTVGGKTQEGRGVSYLAKVVLTVRFPNGNIASFEDIGSGKGYDYTYGFEADESAAKEAVTDGIKRCAKNLGMSMGLALYDKSQENIAEQEQVGTKADTTPKSASTGAAASSSVAAAPSTTAPKATNEKTLAEALKAAARVLNSMGKLKTEEFKKEYVFKQGVDKVDALSREQKTAALAQLKTKYPELGLN